MQLSLSLLLRALSLSLDRQIRGENICDDVATIKLIGAKDETGGREGRGASGE